MSIQGALASGESAFTDRAGAVKLSPRFSLQVVAVLDRLVTIVVARYAALLGIIIAEGTAPTASGASMPDRSLAKHLVTEIVRVAGGTLRNKVHLYKAFYYAHLYYAQNSLTYLSDWPIVRMPNGPGIDRGDELIAELIAEGILQSRTVSVGPHRAHEYSLVSKQMPDLSLVAIDAIRAAWDFVKGRTANELSEITHEHSRSWRQAKDGEELNLYLDLQTDEEYAATMKRMYARYEGLVTTGTIGGPTV